MAVKVTARLWRLGLCALEVLLLLRMYARFVETEKGRVRKFVMIAILQAEMDVVVIAQLLSLTISELVEAQLQQILEPNALLDSNQTPRLHRITVTRSEETEGKLDKSTEMMAI